MTIEQAKAILQEFDRLNLEIDAGLNLLTEHGKISDLCVTMKDIANADGARCVEFLRGYKPHSPPFHTPENMGQFR
jgi:hypothetical protein